MSLTLLLRCNDLTATRAFYGALPGFAVHDSVNTLTVAGHGGKLIFTPQDLWHSAPACSGTLYFTVPDVERLFAEMQGLAALAWPLQDMAYGSREFCIRDCDGYLLAFQQQVLTPS